ncbi:MAG: ATPase, T2SS/T4P/T4SS family [Bdellovibrionia bacterium]
MSAHIIGIIGGKGGVGKSVFAANLAFAFLLETRAQVLLIDLDAKSCGDQNVITGLRPLKTVRELTQFTGSVNTTTVPSLITRHASGLYFLGAVRSPDETLNVDADLFGKQLEMLSRVFNYIIVDLGSDVGPAQMAAINQSSINLLVTTPEILAVNQTYRLMNELMAQTLPGEMLQIVVNKAANNGMPMQTISQMLRKQIFDYIPLDDITATSSLQKSTPFVLAQAKAPIAAAFHDLARKLNSGVMEKLKNTAKPKMAAPPQSTVVTSPNATVTATTGGAKANDAKNILKLRIHSELIKAMDLKKGLTDTGGDPAKEAALKQKTQQSISQIIDRDQPNMNRSDRAQIIKEVLDEALSLGPLEDLLNDSTVTEIMVNGKDTIFIEREGKITKSQITFTSNQQLRLVIERIVTPLGRQINERTPYVDARLKDGSRVHAIIEPLSIDGPAVTIRKFAKTPVTWKNYVEWGSMTQSMVDFLRICVENGLNVIISGGTGSGKTTLLNVLSGFIPATERIITVEDAAELQLKQSHVVRLETRPANMEGSGQVSIRDLIRNTLRMRPDRIVVGECRGGEALDMLQAMNTGHDGSMTTVHSNSPREAIGRIETLCAMAETKIPSEAIKSQIASAVDLIIQIGRLPDGSRKVKYITEVVGVQGDIVTLNDIFLFKEEGFDKNRKITGRFQAVGNIPTFLEEFQQRGIKIPRTLFSNTPDPVKKASG